jgi:plasmid replication initiation protein
MPVLKKDHLVKKRNVLNEIRANNMSLTELRFFSIYLSRINPAQPGKTRVVRFPLDDFRAIMELSSRLKIDHMKSTTNSLLGKVVNVPIIDDKGKYRGYEGFQLFKECRVSQEEGGEWFVEIDAHDKALPLMFEFKNKYFTYQLFNALRLKSPNQLRMYEILKQYQTAGERVLTVDELRDLLGIGKDEYPRYNDFKKWVLDACQQALAEHTDIKYTYEPHGKKGAGGKVLALKFIIGKNEEYTDQLTLDMFIDEQKAAADHADHEDDTTYTHSPYDQRIELLKSACDDEFTIKDIEFFYGKILEYEPHLSSDAMALHDYLQNRYRYMNRKKDVRSRFAYLKSLIGKEI